jgi:hypothetical protein
MVQNGPKRVKKLHKSTKNALKMVGFSASKWAEVPKKQKFRGFWGRTTHYA